MSEADPAAVAVEEARAAGLRIFLDAGMNSTYVGANAHFAAYTSQFAREHPELMTRTANIGCRAHRQICKSPVLAMGICPSSVYLPHGFWCICPIPRATRLQSPTLRGHREVYFTASDQR